MIVKDWKILHRMNFVYVRESAEHTYSSVYVESADTKGCYCRIHTIGPVQGTGKFMRIFNVNRFQGNLIRMFNVNFV